MHARLLADAILLLHFAFILFAVFGAFPALRWPRLLWAHVPAVLWSAWVHLAHRICPLTPLENEFRYLAGESGYSGGFVENYVFPLVYPGSMTRTLEFTAGIAVFAWNALLYIWIFYRLKRRRDNSSSAHATRI